MDFFVFLHTEEEGRRIENAYISEFFEAFTIVRKNLCILAVRVYIFRRMAITCIFKFFRNCFEVGRRQNFTRTFCQRFLSFENNLLQFFREPLIGNTDTAFKKFYNRLRKIKCIPRS